MIEPGAVLTARRLYLLMRYSTRARLEFGLESTFQYLQSAEPGTALATDFPGRAQLAAAGYTALEDLQGCTPDELVTNAGISYSTARAAAAVANA